MVIIKGISNGGEEIDLWMSHAGSQISSLLIVVCVVTFVEGTGNPSYQQACRKCAGEDDPEPVAVVAALHFSVDGHCVLFESVRRHLQLLALHETVCDLAVPLHHWLQVVQHHVLLLRELIENCERLVPLWLIVIPFASEFLKASSQLLEESL